MIRSLFLVGCSLAASQGVRLSHSSYHALIMENTKSITMIPRIQVTAGAACSYDLTWAGNTGREDDPPFQVDDGDPQEPKIIPTKEPNCEQKRNYRLLLQAYDCEPGKPADNATIHINVEDENEFEPEFAEGAYQATARENHMHTSPPILQVVAHDQDCTPKKSDICKYEILSSDADKAVPFQIDAEGNIRNSRPLVYEESHNYIFEVVAYDCSMKQSKPVSVSISVQKECHMQWSAVAQQIDYSGGSVPLYGNAQLDTCPSDCEIDEIFSKIQLDTKHIGKGCDRDTYSVRSQRKICNANSNEGELTTLLGMDATQVSKQGSKAPVQDKGNENSPIYFFDGKTNALLLPRDTFHQTKLMTVQFWMKHDQNTDKKTKEHIICSSDSHKMNRHHFSVFLHNCHLVLLIRQHSANSHKLYPAEFRWRVAEICDFEWHHYTVNIENDQVTLYIDGKPIDTPDIVDDWPIHKNSHVGNETTTVVGACWQAKQSHMAMHFKGYLSDLVILNNATEQENVLKCMYQCKENLVRTNGDAEEPLSDVVTLSADSVESIERQIARINYRNTRHYPTPGKRMVHLYTHVKCTNGQSKKLPMVETVVSVAGSEAPEEQRIQISSEEHNLAKEYQPIKQGVDIFETINIKVQPGESIDSCTIQVFPALNPDHESLKVPEFNLEHNGLTMDDSSTQQIKLRGPGAAEAYQKVISSIVYYNKKPAYYLNRAFKLQCYQMGDRFASNEYIQTLTVIHPSAIISASSPQAVASKLLQAGPQTHTASHRVQHLHGAPNQANPKMLAAGKHSNSSSIGIAAVVVAGLVGSILVMVGIMRRRRDKAQSQGGQLQWDDSALTITVNPLSSEDWDQCNSCNMEAADDTSGDSSCAESDDSDDEGKSPNSN